MEFLQDIGSWILGALFVVLAAFLIVKLVGDALGFFLGTVLGAKPKNSAEPSEWRSTAEVLRAFEQDPDTGALRGKITAQGEIWSAIWVDDSSPPPEVGAEVAIIELEGLVAQVGPRQTKD